MNKINNQTKNARRKQTLNLNEKCNEWLEKEMVNYVDGNPETMRYGVVTKEEADMYILEVHHYM